jgi:predicted cupin superfamily sugar epimerase
MLRRHFLLGLLLLATVSSVCADEDATTAERIKQLRALFDFKPISQEGGYFYSTYHSEMMVPGATAGEAERLAGSAIYFLMGPGDFSALHQLKEDEIYHFYNGSPIELLQLFPDGTGSVTICGPDFWKGQLPQVVIKHGTWQGSRPLDAKGYSLLGTTMTPGFTASDFKLGKRGELTKAYPKFAQQIEALTR